MGITGALLAVPITAVGWTVIKTWSGRETTGTAAAAEPEAVSA